MRIRIPKKLKCERCNHKWIPRKDEVRICPNCKSAYWDTPKDTTLKEADSISNNLGKDIMFKGMGGSMRPFIA